MQLLKVRYRKACCSIGGIRRSYLSIYTDIYTHTCFYKAYALHWQNMRFVCLNLGDL